MKKLAFTLAAIFGLGFVSLANTTDVERPIKKAMKKEKIQGKILDPHKHKARTYHLKEKKVPADRVLKKM